MTISDTADLRRRIEALTPESVGDRDVVTELLSALESGAVRAAVRRGDGVWEAVPWVKQGILMGFRLGALADASPHDASGHYVPPFSFFDKDLLPVRRFSLSDGVRIVPGGTTIRRGSHVAQGVTLMPPAFVNVGAFIDRETIIDSHALVGSCAQVGVRVHVSAGAQIGGVLEPINASPVVVEDDAIIGGNCGVYEGSVVRARAVLAAGVILTRSTPVYDLVNEVIHRATPDRPLEIPPGAVVIAGSRPASGGWARDHGLGLATPIIVKYRDAKTDAATALEAALR